MNWWSWRPPTSSRLWVWKTREQFDLHLAECPACEDYLQQLLATIETLSRSSGDQLDPDFRQRLLQAFRDCR